MAETTIDTAFSAIQSAFNNCADFNARRIVFGDGKTGYLLNIGSYTDRDYISESIVSPLLKAGRSPLSKNEVFSLITSSELSEIIGVEDAISKLLSGFAIIMIEIENGYSIFCCQVRMVSSRSTSEPESEVVLKGPREGFIESSEDNLALLRKRLKTTKFKAERLTIGEFTDTTVYICYIAVHSNMNFFFMMMTSYQKAKYAHNLS